MQNTTSQLCKAAPAGVTALVDAPCDGASRAQRWRVATVPAAGSAAQASTAQILAQDSRLEAAAHAGQCAYLDKSGTLKYGACLAGGKPVATMGATVRSAITMQTHR